MALTIAAGSVTLESPNRVRIPITGGIDAGTETLNLVTLVGSGGATGANAADVAVVNGLLARAGLRVTGETAARVRSLLHATARISGRTAPAANVYGVICDLDVVATVPTLAVGVIDGAAGGANDGAPTVDLEINHSIAQ